MKKLNGNLKKNIAVFISGRGSNLKSIVRYSSKKKIGCFASVFSEKDLSLYSKITKNVVKVPSHEAYNFKLIKKCIKTFKLVLISCGCLKKRELMSLLNLVANKKNVVLNIKI